MGTPVSLREITKAYPATGAAGKNTVVDRVSLDIRAGEMFFLLGPSGCGKTTLLRMIAGFIEPDSGRVLFGEREVTYVAPQKRNTGMVFQSYATWPHMTVRGNVAFGLETRKSPAVELANRVNESLAMVQMEHLADRKPAQLSGGQQQRVALARAIAVRPDVLLLDEPLSNLDAKLRVELRTEIRRVCKAAGITSIYVTHDQREAMSIADRIAVMRAGRVEQLDSPVELYRRPCSRFCAEFMGDVNIVVGEVLATGAVVTVRTGLGELRGVAGPVWQPTVGTKCLVAFRPESVRVDGVGRVGGGEGDRSTWNIASNAKRTGELAFLGEVWHQSFEVAGLAVRVTGLGTPTTPTAPTAPAARTILSADSIAATSLAFPIDDTTILPMAIASEQKH